MSKYNLNEGNESLKKILLLMKYDNKKTLTENVGELEEDNFTDNLSGFASGAAAGAIAGSFFPGAGTVIGGAIGGLIGLFNSSGNAYSQISSAITQYCTPEKSGKPTMSDSELNAIADEIYDGIDYTWGTDEEGIKSALSGLETFPDFCAMAKKYKRRQGETLLDALDGDIDIDSTWRKYVWIPIVDIIERTKETIPPEEQKDGDEVLVPTPEEGKKSKYKKCTGTYKKYCYNKEVIGKVQGCLGITDDGAFGPKTQEALEKAGFKNGFTDADVEKICKSTGDGKKEEPNVKIKDDTKDEEEIETITTDVDTTTVDTINVPDANLGKF